MISCGKDDDTYNYQNPTEQGGGNNDNNDNNNNEEDEEDNISPIVSQKVSVNVSYQHYAWKIIGNTTLKSNLSGHNIKYGIYCGYTDMLTIAYTRYFEISDGDFEFLESIFVDASPYVNAAFWWDTYIALIEKHSHTQEEQDLYDACVDEIEKVACQAKSTYWGQFFAELDGKRYVVKEW